MKIMTIPVDFKWVEKPLEELNMLSEKEKQRVLKKEEIKIRQSIGEAVPTNIFFEADWFFLLRRQRLILFRIVRLSLSALSNL